MTVLSIYSKIRKRWASKWLTLALASNTAYSATAHTRDYQAARGIAGWATVRLCLASSYYLYLYRTNKRLQCKQIWPWLSHYLNGEIRSAEDGGQEHISVIAAMLLDDFSINHLTTATSVGSLSRAIFGTVDKISADITHLAFPLSNSRVNQVA